MDSVVRYRSRRNDGVEKLLLYVIYLKIKRINTSLIFS